MMPRATFCQPQVASFGLTEQQARTILGMLAELTPDLENYTIATYTKSNTTGFAGRIEACNSGTVTGVVLVHAAHGLVLAVWIASAAFAAVDASLDEAARNLGATPLTCFRTITLPLASRGIAAGAVLGFSRALGEFGATVFVALSGGDRTSARFALVLVAIAVVELAVGLFEQVAA